MARCWAVLTVAVVIAFNAAAQQQGLRDAVGRPAPAEGEIAPPPVPGEEVAPLEGPKGIEALGLEEKVAQLMIVRLNGQLMPDNFDRQVLEQLPPGGVILPTLTMPQDVANYVQSLRANQNELVYRIPFLIGADVFTRERANQRVGEEPMESYLQLPSLMTFAAAGSSPVADALMDKIAGHLAQIGINFHAGPSLAGANSIDPARGGVDHFGNDYTSITQFAESWRAALEKHGLVWMPMGFPGGVNNRSGDTMPVLVTAKSALRAADLQPFLPGIEGDPQVPLLNVGNVLAPTLDSTGVPASVSTTVLSMRLRRDFGYGGLIVAGPMDGRYLRRKLDPGEASREALLSGADMLLWESNTPLMLKAIARIVIGVRAGDIDEALINERVERVLAAKEAMGLLEKPAPAVKKAEELLADRAKWIEPTVLEIGAITLVRNRGGVLPLSNERSLPVGITGAVAVEDLYDAIEKDIKQIGKQNLNTAKHTTRIEDFELERLRKRVQGMRTAVCLFSDEVSASTQAQVLDIMKRNGSRTVVVLFGHPRSLAAYDAADAIVVVYGKPSTDSAAVAALGNVLLGRGPIEVIPGANPIVRKAGVPMAFDIMDVIRTPTGRLPIDIPGMFKAGDSVSYRPDPESIKVRWEFGDGENSKDAAGEYAYAKPGIYHATLTITPKGGAPLSGTYEILVQ